MREQRVRGAVELRDRNDVAAHLGEIEHRVIQRRLPRTHAQRLKPALKRGDAALEHCGGRIADAAVAIALGFEIEQSGAVIGAVELVGHGLIDRDRDGPGGRISFVTAVDGHRIAFHASRRAIFNPSPTLPPFGFLSVAMKSGNARCTRLERITLIVLPRERRASHHRAQCEDEEPKILSNVEAKDSLYCAIITANGADRDRPRDAQPAAAKTRRCAIGCARSKPPRRSPPIRTASFPTSSQKWRKSQPDAPALLAAGESLTYRRAGRAAQPRTPAGRSIKTSPRGETVCLMMPNRPEYMAIWLGLSSVGVVVSLINTQLRGPSLAHCVDIVAPRHVIVAAEFCQRVPQPRTRSSAGRKSGRTARAATAPMHSTASIMRSNSFPANR